MDTEAKASSVCTQIYDYSTQLSLSGVTVVVYVPLHTGNQNKNLTALANLFLDVLTTLVMNFRSRRLPQPANHNSRHICLHV